MMELLVYNELQPRRNQPQFVRVCEMLQKGNFAQAEVKKLAPAPYYRAKLSDSDRLLFSFIQCKGERVILLLEIIYNHEYDKSRFLHGAVIDEQKIQSLKSSDEVHEADVSVWPYRNPARKTFHILDRPLSFDELQESLFHAHLPLIIVGSAGSGKTVLSLEKIKTLPGEILYVTRSAYLADNARRLYSAYGYDNQKQSVEFLAFDELVKSIHSPQGRLAEFSDMQRWLRDQGKSAAFDAYQLFEEFSGVITGSRPDKGYLNLEDYLALGVKQSIFPVSERTAVHNLFLAWIAYLQKNGLYTDTLLCHQYLKLVQPKYDYLIVDEVQDLTNVQLFFALKCLKNPFSFLLCGDSNQIVHPNFFNWSAVKSLFYREKVADASAEIKILHANYRNSQSVTETANQILRLKVARFGSVDKESNFLVDCVSEKAGEVQLRPDEKNVRKDLNEKTAHSVHYAVIVLREADKAIARQVFKTPLIFSVREAKGLEYRNIIIFNLVSSSRREFDEVCEGVDGSELQGELKYSRNRDKTDKSLEIFKFFINSMYVAVTRAIENLYWIEHDSRHAVFRLLNLQSTQDNLKLSAASSSSDEWRQEAAKLAAQGKQEQASRILSDVLKLVPVPWEITTRENFLKLVQEALDPVKYSNKAKQRLLDYAHAYQFGGFKTRLLYTGYKHAGYQDEARRHYQSAFHVPFNPANRKNLNKSLEKYGIDFRDAFNRTPLMIACEMGDAALAEELLNQTANAELLDNHGFSAFHYMLRWIISHPQDMRFCKVYKRLEPQATTVRIVDREVKIERQKAEFFLFNLLWATNTYLLSSGKHARLEALTSNFASQVASLLPDFIIADYRKKQQYCSSILAKSEMDSNNPYSLRILYRIQRGHYILNPLLEICLDGKWVLWDEAIGLRYLEQPGNSSVPTVVNLLLRDFRRGNKNASYDHMHLLALILRKGLPDTRGSLEHPFSDVRLAELMDCAQGMLDIQKDLPPLPGSLDELNKKLPKDAQVPDPIVYPGENFQERLRKNYELSQLALENEIKERQRQRQMELTMRSRPYWDDGEDSIF
ncbi:MAG: hypothetical protein PHY82_00090 [Lentisphaeria bacterium]|nr:hypothetical protein [Lentisphaeria bacterium]